MENKFLEEENIVMDVGMIFLSVLLVALIGYLFYALICPEKF